MAQHFAEEDFGDLNIEELEEDERHCESLPLAPPLSDTISAAAAELTGLWGVEELTIRSVGQIWRDPLNIYGELG